MSVSTSRLPVFGAVAAALVIATFLLLPTPEPPEPGSVLARETVPATVFREVRVFDGERFLDPTTVVVEGPRIAEIGPDAVSPPGAKIVEGAGRTLLPGLIDAHTHSWGDALERALVFGVTTQIDMFTAPDFAAAKRAEQTAGAVTDRADLISAGVLVTAPGGHGTQFGIAIPTLERAADADAFVAARLEEGSDFIKIVLEDGSVSGRALPTLDLDTAAAVVAAAHRRDAMAVVHASDAAAAQDALETGADGLVHLFVDRPGDERFVGQAADRGLFVIPTLTILESVSGTPSGQSLLDDEHLAGYFNTRERGGLGRAFPARADLAEGLRIAQQTALALHEAGVPILAGSDAPNPGTAYGASLHRELELLVGAGLEPAVALAAATSAPARVFGLDDRGRIAPGLRADLLLVEGEPATDVTLTRAIVGVWKAGQPVDRPPAGTGDAHPPIPETTLLSTFDGGNLDAGFGAGWMASTDDIAGGASTVELEIADQALRIRGEIRPGFAYPWAGAIFFPGAAPMAPVDASGKTRLVFRTRGDGKTYRVMLFAESLGPIPAQVTFEAGEAWTQQSIELSRFGADLGGMTGFAVSGGPGSGPFEVWIDDVELH